MEDITDACYSSGFIVLFSVRVIFNILQLLFKIYHIPTMANLDGQKRQMLIITTQTLFLM